MKSVSYVLLLLVLLLAGCVMGCDEVKTPTDLEAKRKNLPVSESHNISYIYNDSSRITNKLTAKHDIERFDAEKKEFYHYIDQGLVLENYNRQGQVESRLTARTARLYQKSGYAVAIGDVVLTSPKNEKLETEKLIWDRGNDRIHTDVFVKITTADEIIFGEGLESNLNFTRYKIFKTRGTVNLKDE